MTESVCGSMWLTSSILCDINLGLGRLKSRTVVSEMRLRPDQYVSILDDAHVGFLSSACLTIVSGFHFLGEDMGFGRLILILDVLCMRMQVLLACRLQPKWTE